MTSAQLSACAKKLARTLGPDIQVVDKTEVRAPFPVQCAYCRPVSQAARIAAKSGCGTRTSPRAASSIWRMACAMPSSTCAGVAHATDAPAEIVKYLGGRVGLGRVLSSKELEGKRAVLQLRPTGVSRVRVDGRRHHVEHGRQPDIGKRSANPTLAPLMAAC